MSEREWKELQEFKEFRAKKAKEQNDAQAHYLQLKAAAAQQAFAAQQNVSRTSVSSPSSNSTASSMNDCGPLTKDNLAWLTQNASNIKK